MYVDDSYHVLLILSFIAIAFVIICTIVFYDKSIEVTRFACFLYLSVLLLESWNQVIGSQISALYIDNAIYFVLLGVAIFAALVFLQEAAAGVVFLFLLALLLILIGVGGIDRGKAVAESIFGTDMSDLAFALILLAVLAAVGIILFLLKSWRVLHWLISMMLSALILTLSLQTIGGEAPLEGFSNTSFECCSLNWSFGVLYVFCFIVVFLFTLYVVRFYRRKKNRMQRDEKLKQRQEFMKEMEKTSTAGQQEQQTPLLSRTPSPSHSPSSKEHTSPITRRFHQALMQLRET